MRRKQSIRERYSNTLCVYQALSVSSCIRCKHGLKLKCLEATCNHISLVTTNKSYATE